MQEKIQSSYDKLESMHSNSASMLEKINEQMREIAKCAAKEECKALEAKLVAEHNKMSNRLETLENTHNSNVTYIGNQLKLIDTNSKNNEKRMQNMENYMNLISSNGYATWKEQNVLMPSAENGQQTVKSKVVSLS